MLVPPANFGIPEEGIYRCSKLETINLSFLETLNLNTIVFIGGQIPSNFFTEFFTTSGIECFVIKTSGDSSSLISPDQKRRHQSRQGSGEPRRKSISGNGCWTYTLTDQDDLMLIKSQSIQRIFRILLDVNYHNVLLVDKTSVVIGLLRKIQKWELSSVISEYRLFAGKNKNYFAETYLELINIRLIQDEESKAKEEKENRAYRTTAGVEKDLKSLQVTSVEDQVSSVPTEMHTVQEFELSMPPELPEHMMIMIHSMELKPEDDASKVNKQPLKQSHSALGIFGNRYRLAFDRRERGEYSYYQAREVKDAFGIGVPAEKLLPSWFKYQRDLWDQQHSVEEHNHYKESIFA